MRWLKTLIVGLIALAVMFVGILFTIHNTQTVAIDLVLIQLPEASLSLWLIAAFALGGALGIVLSIFTIVMLRARLGSTRRRVVNAQRELDRLRTSSMKEVV